MSARPRVLFVTPPYHAGVVESAGVWLPLQLVYLAGHARAAGAEVQIFDAMSRFEGHAAIAREIEHQRPDIVAVTTITAAEPDSREIVRAAKAIDERIVTVLGGVHGTFCWQELLANEPALDLVVRGEGELTMAELVRAFTAKAPLGDVPGVASRRDGIAFGGRPRAMMADLDAIVPAWDLVDWPRYFYRPSPEGRFAIVASSRGCRQACTFCSQQKLWERTWRGRDPLKFVAELEHLRRTYDVRVVMLADETPTVDRERWERLLDRLAERDLGIEILMETRVDDIMRDRDILGKYRAAGVSHIYVGVEATTQAALDLYKKNIAVEQSKAAIELINASGIISETSFVLGTPDDTPDSIARTVELAKWYAPDMAFFLALAPWPYADLYETLAPHIVTRDYRRYNLVEPVVKPKAMTLDETRQALHQATFTFFHDKFVHLGELTPEKRDYLVAVLKLLIEHSYLGAEMQGVAAHASMPDFVKEALQSPALAIDSRRE